MHIYHSKQRCVSCERLCSIVRERTVQRSSVSEHEPQGWLMNWMMDCLAAYQFRELESTERFCDKIFWTNHFNERILEIRYSKKNCRSHHYCEGYNFLCSDFDKHHKRPQRLCKDTPTQSLKVCNSPPVSWNWRRLLDESWNIFKKLKHVQLPMI